MLRAKDIQPKLPLEKDLELTDAAMSHGGGTTRTVVQLRGNPLMPATLSHPSGVSSPSGVAGKPGAWPVLLDGAPDFEQMTQQQRRAYDHHRLTRKFG